MAIAINLYASLLDSREEFFASEITEKRLLAWEKTLEGMELISKFQPLKARGCTISGWGLMNKKP